MKRLLLLLALLPSVASAAIIPTPLPFILQNGQTADATQVMSDFNTIVTNVNANAAAAATSAQTNVVNTFTQPQNIPAGTTLGQAANIGQLDQNPTKYVTDTGAANAYVVTPVPAWASYIAGSDIFMKVAISNTNTTSSVVNVSALGNKAIVNQDGSPTQASALLGGEVYHLIYDGAQFEIMSNFNGGNVASAVTMIAAPINEAQGTNIASAATVNLDTATGNYVHVTGTTTITAITLSQGRERTIVFDGALTFTNGASLLLPGGANITTSAGDSAIVRGEAAGVVRVISYSYNVTPAASGASMVLLSAKTASGSASLIFTSSDFDWTLYDEYEFHLTQLIPATNTVSLTAQVSEDGGATYKNTNYVSTNADIDAVPAGATATNSATTTAFNFSALTISNSTDYGMSGTLKINKPSNTIRKLVRWDMLFAATASSLAGNFGIGQYSGDTGAWTGIKFLYSSGNIASGTIRVYGLRKQ